jgi:two-component system, OmpR family, phosphate regulon sensor histidine kinase PhoR
LSKNHPNSGPIPRDLFPWKIFTRIVGIQSAIILIAIAATGIGARFFLQKKLLRQVEDDLGSTILTLSRFVDQEPQASWCKRMAEGTNFNLLVASKKGEIVCNSAESEANLNTNPRQMAISDALQNVNSGRVSFQLSKRDQLMFGALAINHGAFVIAVTRPLAQLESTTQTLDQSLAFFLVMMAVVLGLFSVWAGRRMIFPLGRVLLKATSAARGQNITLPPASEDYDEDTYGEWSELENSIDKIKADLESKVDILSLEREEQATMMAAIHDAILAINLNGELLFYNSRFALLFAGDYLSEKTRVYELIRSPEVLEAFQGALEQGKSTTLKAFPFERNETKFYFALSVAPLKKRDDSIYGAMAIFHDVSDLKKAEQMRIEFVANVSHELRTPLTAIKGFTETVMTDMQEGEPANPMFMEKIALNVDRLLSLINDLLDLSSIESSLTIRKEYLDTGELTQRLTKQLEGTFARKNQQISTEIRAKRVAADLPKLEQVLTNLLDNASKYTPEGGKISVQWTATETSDVILKVSDTGPGIAPEHQSRLFERFYRVDRGRSRQLGGTGLGLAIVKHVMQLHGGAAWVESKLGQGSSFICWFPAEPDKH